MLRFISPFQEFLKTQAASGVLLIAATVLALVVANSPLHDSYNQILHVHVTLGFGNVLIDKPVLLWINDGLMAVFFLLIGLEIKREILVGELSTVPSAMLPVVGAFGGAVLPALIFLWLNDGTDFARGWAIPMATDIAFAVGLLALLGSRIPVWAKVFLTALAVVDDLIAVLVIAFAYTDEISSSALLIAALCVGALILIRIARIYRLAPYLIVGFVFWIAVLKSGVHATIAGVMLGLFIPVSRKPEAPDTIEQTDQGLALLRQAATESPERKKEHNASALTALKEVVLHAESPLHRLEHALHPWVAFGIIPLFAFANAGLVLSGEMIGVSIVSSLAWGIMLGLFAGKMIGIVGSVLLLKAFGVSPGSSGVNFMKTLWGISLLAGIGFTMSIFIAGLSFGEGQALEISKFGILLASLFNGILGYLVLRTLQKT